MHFVRKGLVSKKCLLSGICQKVFHTPIAAGIGCSQISLCKQALGHGFLVQKFVLKQMHIVKYYSSDCQFVFKWPGRHTL